MRRTTGPHDRSRIRSRRAAVYRPRQPESTPLYRIVEEHLPAFAEASAHRPAFFERLDTRGAGADWPGFVRDEFEQYLRCGVFLHGFCRVRCPACRKEFLVPLS